MNIAIKVDNLNNYDGDNSNYKEYVVTSREQDNLKKKDNIVHFIIPLSIFHYKDYNSDFFYYLK